MNTSIYGATFIAGVVLVYIAFKQFQGSRKIVSSGVKTEAVVIDLKSILGSEGEMFEPVYEYVDLTGNKKQLVSDIQYSEPPMKIGDKLQIYYNDKDKVRMASYWGLYRWPIILFIFAAPFLIIGGGYLLYRYVS